jgi:hypothetical protein
MFLKFVFFLIGCIYAFNWVTPIKVIIPVCQEQINILIKTQLLSLSVSALQKIYKDNVSFLSRIPYGKQATSHTE